jgi:hypothetical protein
MFRLFFLFLLPLAFMSAKPMLSLPTTVPSVALSQMDLTDRSYKLITSHNSVLFVATNEGVSAINIADPKNPTLLDSYSASIYNNGTVDYGTNNVAITPDQQTLLLTSNQTLHSIDISDPTQLQQRDTTNGSNNDQLNALAISNDGTKAFVVSDILFYIFDISDVSNMQQMSYTVINQDQLIINDAKDIVLSSDNTKAYIVSANKRLVILNLDHTNQTVEKIYEEDSQTSYGSFEFAKVVLSSNDQTLFVAHEDDGKLHIYNVSTPSSPEVISTVTNYSITSFALSNDETYGLITHSKGASLIDLNTIDQPNTQHTYSVGASNDIFFSQGLAFVAQEDGAISILTPPFPTSLYEVSLNHDVGPYILNLVTKGDRLFLVSETRGLGIATITTPTNISTPSYYLPWTQDETFSAGFALTQEATRAFIAQKYYVYNGGNSYYDGEGIITLDIDNTSITKVTSSPIDTAVLQMQLSHDAQTLFTLESKKLSSFHVDLNGSLTLIDSYTFDNHMKYFGISAEEDVIVVRQNGGTNIHQFSINQGNTFSEIDVQSSSKNDLELYLEHNIHFQTLHFWPDNRKVLTFNGTTYQLNGNQTTQTGQLAIPNPHSGAPFAVLADHRYALYSEFGWLHLYDITPILFLPTNFGSTSLPLTLNSSEQPLTISTHSNTPSIAVNNYTQKSVLDDNLTNVNLSIDGDVNTTTKATLTISTTQEDNATLYVYLYPNEGILLNRGWNLKSLDYNSSNVPQTIETLWQYHNGVWHAKSSDPTIQTTLETNFSPITEINASTGTWFYATQTQKLTSEQLMASQTTNLAQGWSLVGSDIKRDIDDFNCYNGISPKFMWVYRNGTWFVHTNNTLDAYLKTNNILANEGSWAYCP